MRGVPATPMGHMTLAEISVSFNNDLPNAPWFQESWAEKVRNAARCLVRAYAESYEAVQTLRQPIQSVMPGGLWTGRRLWVAKPLLRDAVVKHIQVNLERMTSLHLRAYIAKRPTPDEIRLRVKLTAGEEHVARAKAELQTYLDKQHRMAALLGEAEEDVHELSKLVSEHKDFASRAIRTVVSLVRRLLPIGFAGWVIAEFAHFQGMPVWPEIAFSLMMLFGYHVFAWLTLPFHDAGYRKYIYFEGYMGRATDGLDPRFPPVSRLEHSFYNLFDVRPPVVISWDDLLPPLHYLFGILLVVGLVVALPFDAIARVAAGLAGLYFVVIYVRRLTQWWAFINQRYKGRSLVELGVAAFHVFDWSTLVPGHEDGGEHPSTDQGSSGKEL